MSKEQQPEFYYGVGREPFRVLNHEEWKKYIRDGRTDPVRDRDLKMAQKRVTKDGKRKAFRQM